MPFAIPLLLLALLTACADDDRSDAVASREASGAPTGGATGDDDAAGAPGVGDDARADDSARDDDDAAPGDDGATDDDASDDAAARDATAAADIVRRYYDAIDARRYRDAWLLWSDRGAASGQSQDEFERGFAETAEVSVRIGTPGRIEGAAGSRYVQVPVVVRAVTSDGTRQRFEGSYTLRRSVVDGATAEQRAWRIHSASLRATDRERAEQ